MRSMIRWNPRNEVEVNDPFDTLEQMVDEMWRSWPFRSSRTSSSPLLRPALDVIENDKEVILRLDLPGLKPEDVNITIDDHTLLISGQVGDTIEREGDRYQVRLDVSIHPFITQVITSQGEVTPDGLVPRAYEESRPGKRRTARFGEQVLTLDNGKTVPRPPGVQDAASQFVELAQRFATGKERLEVGRTVTVWLARPGGLDEWTYDIVGREMLRTPNLGEVEAFHLKPRPLANARGNITAEMWFAPSLQYLPVRIKVIMGSEAYLDLIVDQIEQK